MTRPWRQTTGRILGLLESMGPMTRSEICRHLNLSRPDCASIISRLLKPTQRPPGPRRVHVAGYIYDEEGQRRYPRAIYGIGDKPDARRPKADPKGNKARYVAARKQRVSSVFHLGLTRSQKRQMGYGL